MARENLKYILDGVSEAQMGKLMKYEGTSMGCIEHGLQNTARHRPKD